MREISEFRGPAAFRVDPGEGPSWLTFRCEEDLRESGVITEGDKVVALSEPMALRERAEPVAWTDEQELRDVAEHGCGYLFTVNPITPHADPRRVIKLYAEPPAPVVPDIEELEKVLAWVGDLPVPTHGATLNYSRLQKVIDGCRAAIAAAPDFREISNSSTNNFRENAETSTSGWIKCSERMPAHKTAVLVGCWFGREWASKWGIYIPGHPVARDGWIIPGASWKPTHWQPLPAAPGKEG